MFRSLSIIILVLAVTLFCTASNPVQAQNNWTLSTEHDGVKVYTRPGTNSKLKAIKVTTDIQAGSSQLLAAILDIKTCSEWVYHSKQNVMIKQVSPLELYYYSEVEVPWPVENRDFVVHIQAEQDPRTKIITVSSPCIPGYMEEKEHIVRIRHSVGNWTITPLGKNLVRAEYALEVDPGGSIPAWLINLFATKGPLETFKKLKIHVQNDEYKKAHYAQITD